MKFDTVQILCPYHCGSHLVKNVIQSGYYAHITSEGSTIFYKHTLDKYNIVLNFAKHNKNVLFIILIKSFHHWFISLKKASYSIKFLDECKNKLSSPVEIKYAIMDTENFTEKLYFKNLHQLYLEYIKFYNKFMFDNVMKLNYPTDIIYDKEAFLNKLDRYLVRNKDFSLNDYNQLINKPLKNHGKPNYGQKLYDSYLKTIEDTCSKEEIDELKKIPDWEETIVDIDNFYKVYTLDENFDEKAYGKLYPETINFYQPYCYNNNIDDKHRLFYHNILYIKNKG
jgi:hypothetical protein